MDNTTNFSARKSAFSADANQQSILAAIFEGSTLPDELEDVVQCFTDIHQIILKAAINLGESCSLEAVKLHLNNKDLCDYCDQIAEYAYPFPPDSVKQAVKDLQAHYKQNIQDNLSSVVGSTRASEIAESETDTQALYLDDIDARKPEKLLQAIVGKLDGLAGEIYSEILRTSRRKCPVYALAGTLQALSLIACRKYMSFTHGKLNLYTITVGRTGSGKEHPRHILQQIASMLELFCSEEPRSDKDMVYNLLYSEGVSLYVNDESQSLFSSMKSKESFATGMEKMFLTCATCSTYRVSGNHQREIGSSLKTSLIRLKSQLKNTDDDDNENKAILSQQINKHEKMIAMLETGIPYPMLSLYGSSTPEMFDKNFNNENAGSGLLNRVLFLPPPSMNYAPKNYNDFSGTVKKSLVGKIVHTGKYKINQGNIPITTAALEYYKEIDRSYEDRLNDASSIEASIIVRSGEMISKISSQLAAYDGMVKVPHIELATMIVEYSNYHMLQKLDRQQIKTRESNEMAKKILGYVARHKKGKVNNILVSTLYNRITRGSATSKFAKEEDFYTSIQVLATENKIKMIKSPTGKDAILLQ